MIVGKKIKNYNTVYNKNNLKKLTTKELSYLDSNFACHTQKQFEICGPSFVVGFMLRPTTTALPWKYQINITTKLQG